MLTGILKSDLTVERVEQEIADLKGTFKLRHRTLRAMLAALKAEAEQPAPEPDKSKRPKSKEGVEPS